MSSLLIKNARVVDFAEDRDETANILIENGIIVKITKESLNADRVIYADGFAALPGFVDMHVHLRDPGQTQKEDIITGCNAAAAGGVTSLLAMPNTLPTTDNAETVKYILDKARGANANVYVAAAISKGLKSEEITDIEALKEAGAVSLTDDGRPVENTKIMAQAMRLAQKLKMSVTAHCEDLYLAKGGIINDGEVSESLGVQGIPPAAENTGTAREISLAHSYGVPVHICHVSTKEAVQMIRAAKSVGVKVTAETAPHYFTLTEKELLKRDADYRMNPPLRTEQDRLAIIEGLKDGTLDAIATDHAPHTVEEKSDFTTAPNGSVGMETSFSAAYTMLVKSGEMSLLQLVEKMAYNPAKILGINAGTLKEGAPADIALVNLSREYTVDENKLHGKSKNTPFKGMRLCGKVEMTILGGRVVYGDNK
ncbi:MAG: dihydroorotase [Acutalibacteraceae bacterium]